MVAGISTTFTTGLVSGVVGAGVSENFSGATGAGLTSASGGGFVLGDAVVVTVAGVDSDFVSGLVGGIATDLGGVEFFGTRL